MGLLIRMRAAVHALSAPAEIKGALEAWSSVFASGIDQLLGGTSLTRPFSQHPTVYASVSAIATNIAALELEMFPSSDKKRERPVEKSVVKALIETPNEELEGGQLIESTMQHLELFGNAFWYLSGVARNGPSAPRFPTRMDLWEPDRVKQQQSGGRLTGWEYRGESNTVRAGLDRVVHLKYPNPYDRVMGLSPMAAAAIVAAGDYKSNIWNDAFFENYAMPFGVLSPDPAGSGIIQEESLLRLRDQLEARHQGPRKHGRIAAIKAAMKFTELGVSQKDMDFANLMDKATEKILMVWKVPPAFAGVQRDANYGTSIQQAKQFWQNHLPKAKYLERMIKVKLCDAFGIAEWPFFKTEAIKAMIEDQKVITEMARAMFNIGVPFSQINDRLELGYDADEHESMAIPWIPFSLVNADEQAMAEGFDEPLGGPDREPRPDEGQNQPGDPPTQEQHRRPRLVRAGSSLPKEVYRAMNWKALVSRIREEENAMERRVRQHLFGLRSEVLRKIRRFGKAVKQDDDPAQIDIEAVMFDRDEAAQDIRQHTAPVYKSALDKGVKSVMDELRLDVDFSLLTPEVEAFLLEKRFEIAELVDGPVADRLRAELREGLRNGESVERIADRVEEAFAVERSRARRIARTEVAESFNGGRYESMKAAEVKRIEWLTARDARVRDEHVVMDGEVIVLGDTFSNGLRYPLDPAGAPEQIVNCRCVPLPAA